MKKEKLSFKSIKRVLTRDELKNIMGGSDGCGNGCYVTEDPTLYCRGNVICTTCVTTFGGNAGTCQG